MHSNPDREALIEETMRQIRKQLEEKLPADTATLDQIEEAVADIGSAFQRDLQQRIADKRAKQPRDNRLACPCGGRATYKDMQTRTLITRHGRLPFRRPWYYCPGCKQGFSPLDRALGLDQSDTSLWVRQQSAHLSARLTFEESVTTLKRLSDVNICAATVERVACHVGGSLQADLYEHAQKHRQGALPDQKTACPRRLYVSVDGLMVPLRQPWKKDGSEGALNCRYAECKLGVVYETNQDKEGKDSGVRWQDYVASFEDCDKFAPLVGLLAHRNGHHAAKEVVFLSDGAVWIRHLAAREFPGAVYIVDFFHACDHLAKVADARFGKGSAESLAWQQARQVDLKSNRLDQVLREIKEWRPSNQEKRELRQTEYLYFANNAERMRYQTFLEQGYHIGSGVVEASCKRVVAQRLDQAGMHWRQETAEAMVALRAAELSSHSPDFRPHCAMVA
jgi:hypothetical protein